MFALTRKRICICESKHLSNTQNGSGAGWEENWIFVPILSKWSLADESAIFHTCSTGLELQRALWSARAVGKSSSFHPCPEVSRAGQAAGTLERNKTSSALLCGYCRTCSVLLRPLLWRLVTAPRWSGRCHVAHVILDDITATVAMVGARWSWLCHTVEKVQNHIPKWEGALFQSWPKVSMISVTFGPFGFPELFTPPCFLGFQICRWSLVQHRRPPCGQGWRYWIAPSSQGPAVLRLLFRHRELERSSLS